MTGTHAEASLARERSSSAAPRDDAVVAIGWLATFIALGVVLALLYPDSYQQDGGVHFLFARDAWSNHALFVDVWGRPAFTALYAIPARFGYLAAKLFTVLVCAVTAWETYRIAVERGMPRAALAIPFLVLQPSALLLASDTMTEPLFAALFAIALRLHYRGRFRAALLVASLLPLARPEGFFICALWSIWTLWRGDRHRLRDVPLLGVGVVVWWLAALVLTRDAGFIVHNWPPNWAATGAVYGTAPWLSYWSSRTEIVAGALFPAFAIGLGVAIARRRLFEATTAVLVLFAVHSVLRHFGLFGSAGYPRYFVCVSPAIALLTLEGWNAIGDAVLAAASRLSRFASVARPALWGVAAVTLVLAARSAIYYADDQVGNRDARAIAVANGWLDAHPTPVRTLVWSQAYMCIVRACDGRVHLLVNGDRTGNIARLRAAPGATLVFWDGETGPGWYGLSADDFRSAGYTTLFAADYELSAVFQRRLWYRAPWRRRQQMSLYYKRA